ncbi:MAG: nitroreductase [Chloroflexota bacterium]
MPFRQAGGHWVSGAHRKRRLSENSLEVDMELNEAIQARRSIRDFKADPVPRDVLEKIVDIGTHAPSSMNIQPWKITVVGGEVLAELKRENAARLASGVSSKLELEAKPPEGDYRQRQVDLAIGIFKLLGIGREDKDKRRVWYEKGFRFFDAPAAIILSVEKSADPLNVLVFDLGLLAQTICLAAVGYGLGTCIERQGIGFPDLVRKCTGIPESHKIVIGIAVGYPNWQFPVNGMVTGREPLGNVCTWCGF